MKNKPTLAGRLAAEFAVIVLGVIVALAADGWRSERDDRAALRETLMTIESELVAADSVALARESAALSDQLNAGERLILLRENPGDVSQDSVSALFDAFTRSGPLALSSGGYASLRSTRGLDVMKDDDLRRAVTDYYEFRHPMVRRIRSLTVDRLLLGFLPRLERHTVPWLDTENRTYDGEPRPARRLDVPVETVFGDGFLLSGVGTLLEFLHYYDATLGQALEDNQELLARVRADLDR